MRHWAYESDMSDAEIARLDDKVESTDWLEVVNEFFESEETRIDFFEPLNVTLDSYIRITNPKYKRLELQFPFDNNGNGPKWTRPNIHKMEELKGDNWVNMRLSIRDYIWSHRNELDERIVKRLVKRYGTWFRDMPGAKELLMK